MAQFRPSFIQFYGRLLSLSSQFNLIIIDLRKQKRLFGDHHLGSQSASLINTHRRTVYVIVPDTFSARLGHASRKRIWPREAICTSISLDGICVSVMCTILLLCFQSTLEEYC